MTESARKSLLGDSLHSVGTKAISIPLGFLFSVLLARSLGPEGKGGYDLFVATGGLLVMVLGFSLPSGIIYVTAHTPLSLRALARWLALVSLLQGLLALFLLSMAGRCGLIWTFLPRQGGERLILLSAVYVCLMASASYGRAILIGRDEIISANQVALLARLVDVLLLLVLLGVLWFVRCLLDLRLVVGLLLTSSLVANALFLLRLRVLLMSSSGGGSGFRQVVTYSAPCYAANLVQFLNYRMDTFLVSFFAGQRAVGLYALAVSLVQMLWLLPDAVATALLPKVAGRQEFATRNARMAAQATRLSLWVSLVAGGCLGVVALAALPLVYGEPFRESIAPLLWLLPGVVAIGPAFVPAAYIGGIGKPHLNLYVSAASLFLTVLLDLLLIPTLGIIGAAVASTASYSFTAVLTAMLFCRETELGLAALLLPARDDAAAIAELVRDVRRRVGWIRL